jgi:hypothetical protein
MQGAAENQRTGDRIRRGRTPPGDGGGNGGSWAGLFGRRRTDGPRWHQLVYWLIYRLGLIVWKRARPPAELVALVEGPWPLPAGRGLDLSCGTGTDTIYLDTHGWDVSSVDMTRGRWRSLGAAPPPLALSHG